jgi:hypothetical protein
MMPAPGYNPLRWDCGERGCFNKLKRPKIEMFAECLPRRTAFSDVDGIVELSGNALLLEWKKHPVRLPIGQHIMFSRLSRAKRLSVLCVAGDAETMAVTDKARYFDGEYYDWKAATLADVKTSITRWAQWARANPRIG